MRKNTFVIEVIFKRIEKITYIYKETREKVDERLKSVNTNWTLTNTKLLLLLTDLLLKWNDHIYEDSRWIGIAFLRKPSKNTGQK